MAGPPDGRRPGHRSRPSRSAATADRLDALGIGVALTEEHAGVVAAGGPQDAVIEFGAGAAACRRALPMLKLSSTLPDLKRVVELAVSGRLDLSASVSHRFDLTQAAEALAVLDERPPGFMRVVVTPDSPAG